MDQSGHFNWSNLGKPDYSQATALVASLPGEIRNQIQGPGRELLCRLVYLSWSFAVRSGRNRGYCIPSESWLAKRISRSDRTVRRHLTILRELKLLSWVRRMTPGGAPTTNLYTIGSVFLASLYARGARKVQRNQDRTKMSNNDLKKGIEAAPKPGEHASSPRLIDILRLDPATLRPLGA